MLFKDGSIWPMKNCCTPVRTRHYRRSHRRVGNVLACCLLTEYETAMEAPTWLRLVNGEGLRASGFTTGVRYCDRTRDGASRDRCADKLGVEHLERGADSVETDCGSANEVVAIHQHRRAYCAATRIKQVNSRRRRGQARIQSPDCAVSELFAPAGGCATKFRRTNERAICRLNYANFRRVAVGTLESEGLEHRSILRVDRENTAHRSRRVRKVGIPQVAVGSQEERRNVDRSCERCEWRKGDEVGALGADFKKVDLARCNGFEGSIEIAVGALGQSTDADIKQCRLELEREFTHQRELEDILIEAMDVESLRDTVEVAVAGLNHAEWFKTISGGGQSMENGKSAGRRLETEDGAAAGSWARANRRSAILCGPVKVAVLSQQEAIGNTAVGTV